MSKRRIDEFEIAEPIGVGTVGTIYRARDLKRDCEVALKILLPAVSQEPLVLARFEREMVILSKLSHPNIVPYYGGGRSGNQLFFAMGLMAGGSLKDLLAKVGALSFVEAATCGVQIASALQHAHNHGVIHRDLKPSNLLFDQDGKLKLVDFGIARDTHEADITSDGLTVGSYAYMAPEQIQGKKEITGHVDLYALGCVLFEMLTGKPPFTGDNFAQIFEQHLRSEPPRLRQIGLDVPDALDRLVDQLLVKVPEGRPFSARSVQGQLLQILDPNTEDAGAEDANHDQDVSAATVIDSAQQALAQRIQEEYREVSWWALCGITAAGTGAVLVYWLLSR